MTDARERGAGELTVIEQAERNPAAAREIAAAQLAIGIVWALNAAIEGRGWQAKRLAAELGVGESAVSQVLHGDGNVRVATLGRYARALGYQAKVVLEPLEPGLTRVGDPPPRRRRRVPAAPPAVSLPSPAEFHVIPTTHDGVWAVEGRTAAAEPDRVVHETVYTRMTEPVMVQREMLSARGGA